MAWHGACSQRLRALFGPGTLTLTCPPISLFRHGATEAGMPLPHACLFGARAALIAAPALAVRKVPDPPRRLERR